MILVTGGAGFIGSHLVKRLVTAGESVRVLTRTPVALLGDTVEPCQGDLRDKDSLVRASTGVDVIYHLAGYGSPGTGEEGFREIVDVNVAGTLALLTVARGAGVRRVVFASSASVYGDAPGSPKHEAMLVSPQTPYAMSKVAGEHLCGMFDRRYGLETVALRYFNVFGPGQPLPFVIPRFHQALLDGEQVTLNGGGEQTRDFVYIDDLVTATIQAAAAPAATGQVINVASGHPVSIRQVLTEIAEILGITPDIRMSPAPSGDIKESIADISAAQHLLGYAPSISLGDGLRQSILPHAVSGVR